jgi:hypothetical protein
VLRFTLFSLALALAINGQWASAQESSEARIPPEKRKKMMEDIIEAAKNGGNKSVMEKRLKELESKLEAAQNGKIDSSARGIILGTSITFPSDASKEAFIKDTQNSLEKLKVSIQKLGDDPAHFTPSLPRPKVGAYGRFDYNKELLVISVVDKSSAIIKANRIDRTLGVEVVHDRYLVSGIDTSGMADNVTTELTQVFFVVGTKKVGGSTYFELVPVEFTKDEIEAVKKTFK